MINIKDFMLKVKVYLNKEKTFKLWYMLAAVLVSFIFGLIIG